MKVTFNTADFEATHGRKPKGDGLWTFEIVYENGRGGFAFDEFRFNGKFAEAKRAARRQANLGAFGAKAATIHVGA